MRRTKTQFRDMIIDLFSHVDECAGMYRNVSAHLEGKEGKANTFRYIPKYTDQGLDAKGSI